MVGQRQRGTFYYSHYLLLLLCLLRLRERDRDTKEQPKRENSKIFKPLPKEGRSESALSSLAFDFLPPLSDDNIRAGGVCRSSHRLKVFFALFVFFFVVYALLVLLFCLLGCRYRADPKNREDELALTRARAFSLSLIL